MISYHDSFLKAPSDTALNKHSCLPWRSQERNVPGGNATRFIKPQEQHPCEAVVNGFNSFQLRQCYSVRLEQQLLTPVSTWMPFWSGTVDPAKRNIMTMLATIYVTEELTTSYLKINPTHCTCPSLVWTEFSVTIWAQSFVSQWIIKAAVLRITSNFSTTVLSCHIVQNFNFSYFH